MAYNDHLLEVIRAEVDKAVQRWTAWGTVTDRTVGSTNAMVSFDGSEVPQPVKVAAHVLAVPGDRVTLMKVDRYWVIQGSMSREVQVKYVSSPSPTSTTTTFATVPGLTGFSFRAQARYRMFGYLQVQGAAAADFKLRFTGMDALTSISNGTWAAFGSQDASTATMWGLNSLWSNQINIPLNNASGYVNPYCLFGQLTTGDDPITSDVEWAQFGGPSGTNTFHAGSYIEFQEIPTVST